MFTSYEMAEWHGYEKAFGPINGLWEHETLAQIHELLQTIAYIGGAQAEDNPIPAPTTKDRPGSAYGFEQDAKGLYTQVPEEALESAEEAAQEAQGIQTEGGFEALDNWIADETPEG